MVKIGPIPSEIKAPPVTNHVFVRVPCHARLTLNLSHDPPTRYKYHLALIVVVDKENHTQLAMQALLSHERVDDFVFLFESFKELCQGAHPQVNRSLHVHGTYMCPLSGSRHDPGCL